MIARGTNISYDEKIAYLIEVLKVESYYNSKTYTLTLQNKDISFLNRIEEIIKEFEVIPSKRLLLKIKLPEKTEKKDIQILNKDKEINFHIEKSPFDKNKIKAVTSLPYKRNYDLDLYIKNNIYHINILSSRKKTILKSKIECWIYKDLRFPRKIIFDIIEKYAGDKNSFTPALINTNPNMVIAAFSGLVDAEGTLNWYGLKRNIQIRMRNSKYLEEWDKLLKKHSIGCKFRKNKNEYEINIAGWEDFDRLEKLGFQLYHSKKREKWKKMMGGFKRNQISRDSYKEFYINNLKKLNKKVTAKEFSEYINKSKRVSNHYLLKLEKEKLINCDRNNWPYLYFISTSSVR